MSNNEISKVERFRVAQKVILFRPEDKAVLMLRFSSAEELPRELWGKWDFPGGGLESEETLEAGLLREIREEIGRVKVTIGRPLLVGDWWQKSKQHVRCVCAFYVGSYVRGEVVLNEEHDEYAWVLPHQIYDTLGWNEDDDALAHKIQTAVEEYVEKHA